MTLDRRLRRLEAMTAEPLRQRYADLTDAELDARIHALECEAAEREGRPTPPYPEPCTDEASVQRQIEELRRELANQD